MPREWTIEDQLRFDERCERLAEQIKQEHDRKYVDCGHCGEPVSPTSQDVLACPGCGVKVCRECYSRRKLFSAQSCALSPRRQ